MAKTRVGINGFGRIGRNFFRASLQRDSEFELVAFNDLGDVPTMAHLLAYDSLLGPLEGGAAVEGGSIRAAGHELKGLAERDPAALPWRSEERRVGKEGRSRWSRWHYERKREESKSVEAVSCSRPR